jgi:large subunit ribosomal protein L22
MQAQATVRYLRVSPQKARLVVDLIRGKGAEDALRILELNTKSVAKDVRKLLWSAIANAKEREGLKDESKLKVVRAFVNGGPSLKRGRAQSMGRVFRVLHRTSHVTLVLGDQS